MSSVFKNYEMPIYKQITISLLYSLAIILIFIIMLPEEQQKSNFWYAYALGNLIGVYAITIVFWTISKIALMRTKIRIHKDFIFLITCSGLITILSFAGSKFGN